MSEQPITDPDTTVVVVAQEPVQVLNPFQLDFTLDDLYDFSPTSPENIAAGIKAGPVDESAPKELAVASVSRRDSPLLTQMITDRDLMIERMTAASSTASSAVPVDAEPVTLTPTPVKALKIDMSDPD